MIDPVIEEHNGVRFTVEAVPHGDMYAGRFTILGDVGAPTGTMDPYRPTTHNLWTTQTEALTYATEAAHHAIEGIIPFTQQPR